MKSRPHDRKARLLFIAKMMIQLAVIGLVCWGVWYTAAGAARELAEKEFSIWSVDPWWLLLAGVLYLAGLTPMWWFWHRTMCAMGQRPHWVQSLRAYYVGHLGKYVPGKALVLVLRCGLMKKGFVDTAAATVSVFVETLTMMAVGAVIGAVLLAMSNRDRPILLACAIGLAICSTVFTFPPVCRFVVRLLKVRRASPHIDQAVAGLNWSLLLKAWPTIAFGWLLLGASLWATLRAVPNLGQPLATLTSDTQLVVASVTLASVLGFISLLPGGLGVRELVVIPLLTPKFTVAVAAIAAVLLRLVWLVSELVISAILYWAVRPPVEEQET